MVGIRKALAVGIAYLSCVALALTGQQIAADLQAFLSSGSSVYLPSDPDYAENTTTRWDVYAPPTYVVAVKPALIEDIQKVVSIPHTFPAPDEGAHYDYAHKRAILGSVCPQEQGTISGNRSWTRVYDDTERTAKWLGTRYGQFPHDYDKFDHQYYDHRWLGGE